VKPIATGLPERVRAVLEIDPKARLLFGHDVNGLPKQRENPSDTSASVFDYHLIQSLLRHPTLTRDEIVGTCIEARARAGGDTKANRADYWERTYNIVAQRARGQADAQRTPAKDDVAGRFRHAIRYPGAGRSAISEAGFSLDVDPTCRWPFGMPDIDEVLGGGYGMVVVAGHKGVGKSTIMLNAALNAIESHEWYVTYFDAENAGNVWNRRVLHWFGLDANEIQRRLAQGFQRYWVDAGVTLEEIIEWTCASVQPNTRRMLVIFDSVNTILAKMTMGHRTDYFSEYDRLLLWAQDVRVKTRGRVSFLMASEMNTRDEAQGRKIEFLTDVELAVASSKTPNRMRVNVVKTRETKRPDLSEEYVIGSDFHVRTESQELARESDDDGLDSYRQGGGDETSEWFEK
jgi:KaiC/GvpD/RAD55 family RecA-like ATPase